MERHSPVWRAVFGVVFCAAAAAFPAPNAVVSLRNYFEPGETLVTPHTSWLKPYAHGKVRVLFIVPVTGMREVVELAERMDLDYRVFRMETLRALAPADRIGFWWVPGEREEERLAHLRTLLQEQYDTIVIGGCDWSALPTDARVGILRKVKNGTGLAGIVSGRDETFNTVMRRGIPDAEQAALAVSLAGLPAGMPAPETALFGRGRICLYRYGPASLDWAGQPFHVLVPGPGQFPGDGLRGTYEYQMAFVIKTVLWAARREPDVSLTPEKPVFTVPGNVRSAEATFLADTGKSSRKVFLRLTVINEDGRRVAEESAETVLRPGVTKLRVRLPPLPVGRYRADAILYGQHHGKTAAPVLNYSLAEIVVDGDSRIEAITLDKESYASGEPVKGTVIIRNPVRDMRVRIRRYDNFERLMEESVGPAGETVPFMLRNSDSLTVIQTVEAELLSGEASLHVRRKEFAVRIPAAPRDEMRAILWLQLGEPPPFYIVPVLDVYRRLGIDTHYVFFNEVVPRANLRHISILTRICEDGDPQAKRSELVRHPCLTDPVYRKALAAQMTKAATRAGAYGVTEFSMGDECSFCLTDRDLCFSPTCREDFKRFVREKYRTIENLNAAYGTQFTSFEQAEPVPLETARKTGDIARWVDHRLHMDDVWASIFRFGAGAVQKELPGAAVGYEGSDTHVSTWYADDYWKLSRSMELNNIYYSCFQAAVWRSFFSPDKLLGLGWFGGYGCPYDMKENYATHLVPWLTLLKGANSLWIWFSNPGNGSVTAPDFAPYDFFSDSLAQVREIKSGLDKALLSSRRLTDVGIYYSPASIHAAMFHGLPVGRDDHYQAFASLLVDLGFQPRVYAGAEVVGGVLERERPKALVLVGAVALSPVETAALGSYVDGGGVVLADIRPGVLNEPGAGWPAGECNDLFGVRMAAAGALRKAVAPRPAPLAVDEPALPEAWCDPSVSVTTGHAGSSIEGIPVVITHSRGKGRTAFLNFTIEKYAALREDWPKGAAHRLLLRRILADAGVEPSVRVAADIPGLEVTCFDAGGICYAAFLRDIPGAPPWTRAAFDTLERKDVMRTRAILPWSGHLYDVRSRRYLGRGDTLTLDLKSLEPTIIAVVPYEIGSVSLTVSPSVRPGARVRCTVSVRPEGNGRAGPHAVRVRVFDPGGSEVEAYGRKITADGKTVLEIPLALNDAPGRWMITADDIVSGKQGRTTFVVR